MYIKLIRIFSISLLVNYAAPAFSQGTDTLRVTAKNINSNVLQEGTHRYLVYFKMNKDAPRSQTQFWTRKIERITENGKALIKITQDWEDKDTVMHTVLSLSDAKTMQPLYHRTWWKFPHLGTTTVDFVNNTVEHNGRLLSEADTSRMGKRIWAAYMSVKDNYFLNWHLDMEIFPVLPYKEGLTFLVPFYDPGTGAPFEKVAYTVKGSALLTGYDNQKIDCWLLVHENKGNKEVFWISKKTKEVLKLEQEVNGSFYRYKIKLGFSI